MKHLLTVLLCCTSLLLASCGSGDDQQDRPSEDAARMQLLLLNATPQPVTPTDPLFGAPAGQVVPLPNPRLREPATSDYLAQVDFPVGQVDYYDLVTQELQLSKWEQQTLARHGFVMSDRYAWDRFIEAYAWIYWKDLPVLVTTDSILHAVHQSYSDLLSTLEEFILMPQLQHFLEAVYAQMLEDGPHTSELSALQDDVAIYLEVALALLRGEAGESVATRNYVDLATKAADTDTVDLFGSQRTIDFTLFKPRAHYAGNPTLEQLFRAMSWLAQVDFRFSEADPVTGEVQIRQEQIAAAVILEDAIARSGEDERWQQIDALLRFLVGPSDNINRSGLQRFLADLGTDSPEAILEASPERLLAQLTSQNYGEQQITGQIVGRHAANSNEEPLPRPDSFILLGQRFAIDSYVLGNLVYDRLVVDGVTVPRALPLPADAMYALGNDRALTHLQGDLSTYGYDGYLAALRQEVDSKPADFWRSSLYNRWLQMIRTLNTPSVDERFPPTMRTAAWADKMLHTQLASWAQLRHDNMLHAKQSYTTAMILCEYPAGYVEPYPDFYTALYDFAYTGSQVLDDLLGGSPGAAEWRVLTEVQTYFEHVMAIAEQLRILSEKELRQEPFTVEEEIFLKSIMVKQDVNVVGCGGPRFEEMWDGWYGNLFFRKDQSPALIADVHTNPTNDPRSPLYPPRVLHVATGPVAPLLFTVTSAEGAQLYIGPAFTYFELTEEGFPPVRLTDTDWDKRTRENGFPKPPLWTGSFRPTDSVQPERLHVPGS